MEEFLANYWFYILIFSLAIGFYIDKLDIVKPPKVTTESASENQILQMSDGDRRPSKFHLSNYLSQENFKLYEQAIDLFSELGIADIFFTGSERGWCLGIKDWDFKYGVLQLNQKHLYGHFYLSTNQYVGISTDERLEGNNFKDEFSQAELYLNMITGYDVPMTKGVQCKISNEKQLKDFIAIVQLMKFYG